MVERLPDTPQGEPGTFDWSKAPEIDVLNRSPEQTGEVQGQIAESGDPNAAPAEKIDHSADMLSLGETAGQAQRALDPLAAFQSRPAQIKDEPDPLAAFQSRPVLQQAADLPKSLLDELLDKFEEEGVYDRKTGQFIHDPHPMKRIATGISMGIAGMALGASAGAAGGTVVGAVTAGPAGLMPGFIIGGAGGGAVGGGLGTFFGAMGPEIAIATMELMGLVEDGEIPGLPRDVAIQNAEREVLIGWIIGSGITAVRAGARGVGSAITGFGRTEGAAEAATFVKNRFGIDTTMLQWGDAKILKVVFSIAGRIPYIAGPAIENLQATQTSLRLAAEKGLPSEFSSIVMSSPELGKLLAEKGATYARALMDSFKPQYGKLRAAADELDVRYKIDNLGYVTNRVSETIKKSHQETIDGASKSAGVVKDKVRVFIAQEIDPLFVNITNGVRDKGIHQTMTSMDGLLSKIDQFIDDFAEVGTKGEALLHLTPIRQAVQADLKTGGVGDHAHKIGQAMEALDLKFSKTLTQFLETSTAKKFGTVKKGGLRSTHFDTTTTTQVDELHKVFFEGGATATTVRELADLVGEGTMRRVGAHMFADAADKAITKEGGMVTFDVEKWASVLRMESKLSGGRDTLAAVLETSGSKLTVDQLDKFLIAGRQINSVAIPDVAMFQTRKFILGGLGSFARAVMPSLAVSGALGGNIVAALPLTVMAIGGTRAFSRMITDPAASKSLIAVLDESAPIIARRTAAYDAVRRVTEIMTSEDRREDLGNMTSGQFVALQHRADALEQRSERVLAIFRNAQETKQ